MNVYTSDGLLVSGGTETSGLLAGEGQQLISIYRLFLQLHHAGTGTMRIKDMVKPEATDAAGEHGSGGASGDKSTDRRGGGAARGVSGAANANWSSVMPSMPETATYTSSIAVVSAGIPYPMFLLSSNAIPETHRLRGFASAAATPQSQQRHAAGAAATAVTKNNNRSANGCEEIAVRWSLLTKKLSPCPTAAMANAAAGSVAGSPAGVPTSTTAMVGATAAKDVSAQIGTDVSVDKAHVVSEHRFPMLRPASGVGVPSVGSVAASTGRTSVVAPCAYSSGWTAAELQVHTTKQIMVCTATELSLDLNGCTEDGNSPLLFCCSTQPASA